MSLSDISAAAVGRTLLSIARGTLEADLRATPFSPPADDWLREPAACFVTLHRDGELRGCIGSMIAHRSLVEDLQANARAAAFGDPRFPAVQAKELQDLEIEISLLSALAPLEFESEEDLIRQLRPHEDGLLLEHGIHRGTFLPTVWRSLPNARHFWNKLKAKAGLAEDFWTADLQVQRYTTRSWSEAELDG